jgi:hypothetical protein
MFNSNQSGPSQRSWITTQIAWLSVCIIAAWGGRLLPSEYFENSWGIFGVFGLASALGLASIAAAKSARERRQREHEIEAQPFNQSAQSKAVLPIRAELLRGLGRG